MLPLPIVYYFLLIHHEGPYPEPYHSALWLHRIVLNYLIIPLKLFELLREDGLNLIILLYSYWILLIDN